MATVNDIYNFLDSIAPFDTQESWDNSGFLVGNPDQEVHKIALALDVTMDSLHQAEAFGADLLVSHHPVIFHPLKNVYAGTPVYYAVEHHISIISAHTCWDVAEGGVSDVLAAVIGLQDVRSILPGENGICMLRLGKLPRPAAAHDFAGVVSAALDTVVRCTEPDKIIQTVAVCGGAGASFLPDLKALGGIDCFVTGDAKHNDYLDAIDDGIVLMAGGHYETETISIPVLRDLIQKEFPDLEYTYLESAPATYIG